MSAQLIVRSGLGLMLLLAASQVAAQTRKDVSVGYSYMGVEGEPDLPLGGYVSYAEGGGLRGVVEISGHRSAGVGLVAVQGGVRFGPRTRKGVRPFGQALVGFAVAGANGLYAPFWTAQFGGGIDIPMRAGGPAWRLGLDMPIFFNDGRQTIIRSTIGIVFNR